MKYWTKKRVKKCEILALIEGQFNAKKKINLASERRENLCQICVKSVLNLVEEIGAKNEEFTEIGRFQSLVTGSGDVGTF